MRCLNGVRMSLQRWNAFFTKDVEYTFSVSLRTATKWKPQKFVAPRWNAAGNGPMVNIGPRDIRFSLDPAFLVFPRQTSMRLRGLAYPLSGQSGIQHWTVIPDASQTKHWEREPIRCNWTFHDYTSETRPNSFPSRRRSQVTTITLESRGREWELRIERDALKAIRLMLFPMSMFGFECCHSSELRNDRAQRSLRDHMQPSARGYLGLCTGAFERRSALEASLIRSNRVMF